jgi:hypothetical protein
MSSSQIKGEEDQDQIQLLVSEDKLQLTVSINSPLADLQAVANEILAEAKRLKITAPLSREYLIKWIEKSKDENGLISDCPLVEGTAPEPPVDAIVEWADDFFSSGFKVDPKTGAVDYRQKTGRSSVEKGELLATIIDGKPGKNGKSLFGEAIQVAKPNNAKLSAAKNVEKKDGVNKFYAMKSGRVELTGDRLSVSDLFVISGSVGLESGNIDHPGALLIQQDIMEDSEVKSTGDIEVQGLIEPANIICEGNLHVRGGICGKEGTTIKVAGEVHAKFISDCDVEAGGDIIVEREILHSNVKTHGAVRVPDGRIVGGETTALGGIDVGEAGSEACVVTNLVPGEDYLLEATLQEELAEIKSITQKKEEISEKLQPVLPYIKTLAPKQKEGVIKLLENAKELAKKADEIEENIRKKREESLKQAEPVITVQKTLFPELKVRIKGEHNKFKQPLQGPLKVDCVAAKVRIKSLE